jgi:hypothetical protein
VEEPSEFEANQITQKLQKKKTIILIPLIQTVWELVPSPKKKENAPNIDRQAALTACSEDVFPTFLFNLIL